MKKSVLIIEDNMTQLEMLKRLVLEVNAGVEVHTACNINAAYEILMEQTIDVFLVDIILDTTKPGDASGVRLVEKLRTIPKYMFTPVLFVTSVEDSTKYAYTDLNCLGYVEKPFSPEEVKKLVERALNFSTNRNQDATFCFSKDRILFPVKVRDIQYIDNTRHVVNVHTVNGGILTVPYKTCKELLHEVDTDCLMQCGRSTIVNKDYIENIDPLNRYITLKGVDEKIDIGITFKKKILAEFGV